MQQTVAGFTWGPSMASRNAEMRDTTCCTVSLNGTTTLLRRSNSSVRCKHRRKCLAGPQHACDMSKQPDARSQT